MYNHVPFAPRSIFSGNCSTQRFEVHRRAEVRERKERGKEEILMSVFLGETSIGGTELVYDMR
jgi:hypothetical protein